MNKKLTEISMSDYGFWSAESKYVKENILLMIVDFGDFLKYYLSFFGPFCISASNWATELNKKYNPHGQLIWGGNTFQTSIYHGFPLTSGCVKNIPPSLLLSWLLIENLQATFNKAPIKILPSRLFPCRVDPYLVLFWSNTL